MGKITGHLYKVGDRLRITKNAYEYKKGDIVEVVELHKSVNSDFDYRTKQVISGRAGYVAESFVELDTPAVREFKRGDLVYYISFDGYKKQRTVDRVENDKGKIKVWFTNGSWMPASELIYTGRAPVVEPVQAEPVDNVNNPAHYTKGGIETLDFIKAKLSTEQFAGFLKANIIKYITRYEDKNGLEDLKKAEFYLRELIVLEDTGV